MVNDKQEIRVLVIDDDEDDYFIICDYLKDASYSKYVIDWCYRYIDAVEYLRKENYDVYFVDYKLGGYTGLDFLRASAELKNEAPVILLTGKGNREIDIEAMEEGATDYLVKNELTTEKLERSIRYALERSSTMKALKANEQKYRTIFQKSQDAIFITDTGFRFVELNETTVKLLGLSREELIGRSLFDFIHDETTHYDLQAALIQKGLEDATVQVNSYKGERRFCVLSGEVQRDNKGTLIIQCILHDISSLKKAEKVNLQIEKLAATARLVQTLAHEVRNPLNNINLSVEQLLSYNTNEDQQPLLQIIHRNSNRIANLINELMASARPSEMEFETIDLHKVIDDSLQSASDRFSLQNVKLDIHFIQNPLFIQADISKLKIALLNIIINGIEAVKPQQGVLTIETSSADKHHILKIRDNGCGIPEENISKLFEPYFTSKRNGMGLGLASSMNILQAHKAVIEVQSKVNEGSLFIISFQKA